MTRNSTDVQSSRLLVVDFGSQYTQLIARRIRSLGVYCEICAYDTSPALVQSFRPDGVILSGGPETVVEAATPRIAREFLDLAVPILGICYGMQVLAAQLGGQVEMSERHEFGHTDITPSSDSHLLQGLGSELDVWMSHGDRVVRLPTGFEVSARSDNAPVAAMEHRQRHLYGLQFHPEVSHTPQGTEILRRFVIDICGCIPTWRPANIVSSTIESVREQVGSDRVLLGLSGGVDSSVVAAILSRAIGDQLECLCIDNGLLRKNELREIEEAFRPTNALSINLRTVDATETFLSRLEGVADPEIKRKVVGETFIEVFEREARQLDNIRWLAQGTIYPDVVESAQSKFGKAHVIKSHHNVGGLPSRLNLKLLEPLRELFKDEVRQVGLELGLPSSLVNRHPFPGPGLSVRILGQVKPEDVTTLQAADAIFIEELRASGFYDKVSQAFAVFLPVRSVGVVGDSRRFEPVIALRAVETDDFMTAKFAELPYSLIQNVSNRITNEIPGVSRVVYDVSSKPPATIEWE